MLSSSKIHTELDQKESEELILPQCLICLEKEPSSDLISPCNCDGSMKWIHESCLKKWLNESGENKCKICNYEYKIKTIDNKLISYSEFINSQNMFESRTLYQNLRRISPYNLIVIIIAFHLSTILLSYVVTEMFINYDNPNYRICRDVTIMKQSYYNNKIVCNYIFINDIWYVMTLIGSVLIYLNYSIKQRKLLKYSIEFKRLTFLAVTNFVLNIFGIFPLQLLCNLHIIYSLYMILPILHNDTLRILRSRFYKNVKIEGEYYDKSKVIIEIISN